MGILLTIMLLAVYVPFISLLIFAYTMLDWKIPTACIVFGALAAFVQATLSPPTLWEQCIAIACIPLYAGIPMLVILIAKGINRVWERYTQWKNRATIEK